MGPIRIQSAPAPVCAGSKNSIGSIDLFITNWQAILIFCESCNNAPLVVFAFSLWSGDEAVVCTQL